MSQQIVITKNENGLSFYSQGLSTFEVLGILRYYEKSIWLRMAQNEKPLIADSKTTTEFKTEEPSKPNQP